MLCCEWLECDDRDDDECDRFETVNKLGPSNDTDSRAHDSSNVCSGIIPNDTKLLQTFEFVAVNSAGVDWDSSWSEKQQTDELIITQRLEIFLATYSNPIDRIDIVATFFPFLMTIALQKRQSDTTKLLKFYHLLLIIAIQQTSKKNLRA